MQIRVHRSRLFRSHNDKNVGYVPKWTKLDSKPDIYDQIFFHFLKVKQHGKPTDATFSNSNITIVPEERVEWTSFGTSSL
jgi:hypothetical protein